MENEQSMLTELMVARTIAECGELTAEDLIEAVDGLPPDKLHWPAPAIAALRDAWSHRSADGGKTADHQRVDGPRISRMDADDSGPEGAGEDGGA
jgi:hypothetical protein